jgi:hypothetical protein
MQTLVDRTSQRRILQRNAPRQAGRHPDFCDKAGYAPRRCLRHFLDHIKFHAAQVNIMIFRINAHDGCHAGPERSGYEIGR